MDRRQFNSLIAGGVLLSPLGRAHGRYAVQPARSGRDARELYEWWQKGCSGTEPVFTPGLPQADDEFLEDIERRAFRYFWEQADATTGLVADRARSSGEAIAGRNLHLASIAATGFGLSALAVAAERKWIPLSQARERVRDTLRFLAHNEENVHGWFYHFLDSVTGKRRWKSELSSIDTALLLAGILVVRQKFSDDREIAGLATLIFNRVDFQWMRNKSPLLLSMAWYPERGFSSAYWDMYAEETMLYLMGIGSPTHPLPVQSWYAWKRRWTDYAGYHFLNSGSLFTHQYSHAYVDYRSRFEPNAPYVNYFINSIAATLANRAFCLSLSKQFPGYTENVWGITASDSARGYKGWGMVPEKDSIDGTVVPCAAGGSLMFTPRLCLTALRTMKGRFGVGGLRGGPLWGHYGFVDAFNPNTGWVDSDVLGIDQGITLLSAENLRSGSLWRWFMANSEPARALELIGLLHSCSRAVPKYTWRQK